MTPDENLPLPTGADAVEMRTNIAHTRADVTREMVELQKAKDAAVAELDAARKALEAEFAAKRSELEAKIAPLRKQLEQITEVSWTLDLYLGRDEEVTLLRDGTPAPADEPITIRQMVLFADEESLLLVEEGGLDYRKMEHFIEWVAANPANMARIIPDAKGVVVVRPSRQTRDHGRDIYAAAEADRGNKQAYWFLRNGERLYLLITDPNLEIGDRLLPTRDEFTEFFTEPDYTSGRGGRKPITPGSDAWMRAEQAADAHRRAYMRKMLVLQGLVDRSVVWRPLPAPHLNLLSVAAQDEGWVRLVNEFDMVLTDGRPSFKQWQRALNRRLRPGMRVVLSTANSEWRALHEKGDRWAAGGHRRLSPASASYPPAATPLMVEDRRDGGYVIRYDRTDSVYKRNVPVPDRPGYVYRGETAVTPTRRASVLIYPEDSFVLPYDAATEADLTYYLNSRTNRRGYLDMVPLLRSALEAKQAEWAAEAGFREMLTGLIATQNPTVDLADIDADIDDLIGWWKTANKWSRPLVGEQGAEKDAATAIAREWALRRKHAGDPATNTVAVGSAKTTFGDRLLAVAYTRSGDYKAWTASNPDASGPWLAEHTATRQDPTAWVSDPATAWTTIHPRTLATMRTLYATTAWQTWDIYPTLTEHLTGPELDDLANQMLAAVTNAGATPIVLTHRTYDDSWGTRNPARLLVAYAFPADMDPADPKVRGIDDCLTAWAGQWSRDRTGAITLRITKDPRNARWGRYGGTPASVADLLPDSHRSHRDFDWPWRESGDHYFNPRSDFVLAWIDREQVARVVALTEAITTRQKIARDAAAADENYGYARQITAAAHETWLRERTAEARRRFDEDFGAQAADLWEHHLGTLNLDGKYRAPLWLENLARRLARNKIDVNGRTFADLAEVDATLHTGKKIEVGEWADWTLTMPSKDPAHE